MKVLIVTDQRVTNFGGKFFSETAFSFILNRYKEAFGDITLFAKTGQRIEKSSKELSDIKVIFGGSNVNIFLGKNKRIFKKIICEYNLVIVRLPSVLGYQAAKIAKQKGVPYLSEAMGCAWDQFWNHGLIGKILAPIMFFSMKKAVKNASFATYVTSSFLQKRYPCSCHSLSASNVYISDIDKRVFSKRISRINHTNFNRISIMTAGGVNVRYKGFQFVIKALPLLLKKGIKATYYIVGNGDNSYLKKIASNYGVSEQVIFTGSLKHEEVLALLEQIDIYVQPSLQEGLPRIVIEAMSKACPSCGTRVAGIPELLSGECLFKPKSHNEICKCLLHLCNKESMIKNAQQNFVNAFSYIDAKLSHKRELYYSEVKNRLKQG